LLFIHFGSSQTAHFPNQLVEDEYEPEPVASIPLLLYLDVLNFDLSTNPSTVTYFPCFSKNSKKDST